MINPGKVIIDEATKNGAVTGLIKENIVPEDVGMHGAAWQSACESGLCKGTLHLEFILQKSGLRGCHERKDLGHGPFPPWQTSQVGLLSGKIVHRNMSRCNGRAKNLAVTGRGLGLPLSTQTGSQSGRPGCTLLQDTADTIFHRAWTGDTPIRKMAHQFEIKGQLDGCEFFKKRQYEASCRRIDKIIGVLNSRGDALECNQLAKRIIGKKPSKCILRHSGENRHGFIKVV